MKLSRKNISFIIMAFLLISVGFLQSWNVALQIFNLCLISAIMTLGVNVQWGYAGLVNFGMMGFTALGGFAAVIISMPPIYEAWAVGGSSIILGLFVLILTVITSFYVWKLNNNSVKKKYWLTAITILLGLIIMRFITDPAVLLIEAIEPAKTGYLGGFGLPILISWIVGGILAAGAAYLVGKISLGLRSDYLAIATLGISEIVIYVFKNEDWLTRGVKNVNGLPRPVPYEIELQASDWFIKICDFWSLNVVDASTIFVKICYTSLFLPVLLVFFFLSEKALKSPWGRMMRAIRDNETAANAMGKDITFRHLQVFILGSAIVGVAGAMLTTIDSIFTPASYQPLRFTFLIWVMVIVGGSGNNHGSILGGFIIWFFWVQSEPIGIWLINLLTSGMSDTSELKIHLIESAAHMRLMTMGIILLLMLRFAPRGILPEEKR